MTTEPIPKEKLDYVHKRLCRGVALALISAMRETGTDFADIDARLENPPGSAQFHMLAFITGETKEMREVSDIAYAMGCECHIQAVIPRPPAAASEEDEDDDRS